jgi:hypothetical protein
MADRPTRTFQTKDGTLVVLQEYITGEDNWEIRGIYMAAQKTDDPKTVALNAERKAFELAVISIDGYTDDIAGRVLRLPLGSYKEVAQEVTDLIEGKKKSETS